MYFIYDNIAMYVYIHSTEKTGWERSAGRYINSLSEYYGCPGRWWDTVWLMDAYFSCKLLFFCSHMDNGSRSQLLSHVCKPGLCAGALCINSSPFCFHTLSCFVSSHIEWVFSVSFVLCCMLTMYLAYSLRPCVLGTYIYRASFPHT